MSLGKRAMADQRQVKYLSTKVKNEITSHFTNANNKYRFERTELNTRRSIMRSQKPGGGIRSKEGRQELGL